MIKFFRKIRQRLLAENRFSKYLLYAIGEIVLVVIGILIALQINNTNEAKNNEALLVKILKEIRQDLEIDVVTSNGRLENGLEMDSLSKLVLDEKLTKQEYTDNGDYNELFWIGLQYVPFDFQKTAFNKFENFQGVIPEKYDSIVEHINNYYNVTGKLHNDLYTHFRQQIKDRHDYLANNKDWYYLLRKGKHTPEMMDFYLNDPMYKNWVSQFKADNINGKYGSVSMLHNSGFQLINRITAVLQDNYKLKDDNVVEKFGPPRTDLSQYEGVYIVKATNRKVKILNVNGHLFANQWHMKTIEKDSFNSVELSEYHYSFKRNSDNTVIGVQMYNLIDSKENVYWTKENND